MKKLMGISVVLSLLLIGSDAGEAFAQGHGGQRGGGQQGMRGRGGGSQYGYGGQAGTKQGRMMQNRYRSGQSGLSSQSGMMQQQCLKDGSGTRQSGYGRQGGMGQGQMRGRRGSGQSSSARRGNVAPTGGPLTQQETESLLLMREEEKLARDVYLALGKKWNTPVFANIARSETRHMAVVRGLLDRYGLQDPVVDDTPGVFTNPKIDQLYDDLVRSGSASAANAYRVGVQIEELDIADLKEGLATVSHSDIRTVYQNLLRASQNHLRAFTSQL